MTSVRQVGVPVVGELDRYLIGQGRHERLWTVLGAHPRDGGVAFAVWAPKAQEVHVVGDFDGRAMYRLGDSGIWATFVPAAMVGHRYKYRILGCDGVWRDKADPLAALSEVQPGNASIVYQSHHQWQDADWMAQRPRRQPHREPMSVYELHLGSWRPGLSYRDLAEQLPGYVADLGFTHVEFLPVMEHPYGGSWGYQVSGYYAPTSRFGEPDDFRLLVDRLHQAGIGVILDWVPAHFPRDGWALARFDGGSLYEHGDPRRGEHPDWGTNVFDFGRSEVRNFLVANALYWCEEFHVDGLRVDAVASMLYLDYSRGDGQWYPNQYGGRENLEAISFLQELNATVYRTHPGVVMIAEESTAWPGVTKPTDQHGLGFGFKWNMGCVHDIFAYVGREPAWRSNLHHQMTFASTYAWSENYLLAISHDDVVHGKSPLTGKVPGDRWQRLATVRALLAFMWAHPGKQLLFMGCELAEDREWDDVRGLDWHLPEDSDRAGMQRLVRDLNGVYRAEPALWSQDDIPDGFRWIMADDLTNNTYTFLRIAADGSPLVCVANFDQAPHEGYRIGLPTAGTWVEVLNTDAQGYGGSGVGNLGSVTAEDVPWQGFPASALLRVPPLATLWLRVEDGGCHEDRVADT